MHHVKAIVRNDLASAVWYAHASDAVETLDRRDGLGVREREPVVKKRREHQRRERSGGHVE
jgi:hypothetical protein